MFHDGHLLLILHEAPDAGEPTRRGLFFWRDESATWRSTLGSGFGRLDDLVDRYEKRLDRLEAQLARSEDAANLFDVLRRGSPLRRSAQGLTRALQQAREAIGGRDIIALRDRAQEAVAASELLVTDAKHALDYVMARQAEAQAVADREQAENSAKLNRLAAVFLPLTLLASLFGMKLPSGLETDSPIAFWTVVVGGLLIGFVIGRFNGPRSSASSPSELQGRLDDVAMRENAVEHGTAVGV